MFTAEAELKSIYFYLDNYIALWFQ